jgi:hypothetical protein
MATLYKVSASLKDLFEIKIVSIDARETLKSYLFDGIRLSKAKLLKTEVYLDSTIWLSNFTFCVPDDLEKAKEVVISEILSRLDSYKKNLDKLSNLSKSVPKESFLKKGY